MSELALLTKDDVLKIHRAAIERFGGLDGIRDEGLLESALSQPFAQYGAVELYPTIAQKAARYAYGICMNHPSVDGNKRVATAVMATFLRMNGCAFKPRHDELLATMMGVAASTVSFEELTRWVEAQL